MNLPNQITVGRLVLTMIFLTLATVTKGSPNYLLYKKIGYLICITAGFSDLLDGYLARKYQLITTFGKLIDPLTDKIFTVSCFVVLVESQIVPAWITILILTREFAVTGLRSIAANKGVILTAVQLGKYKTLSQMLVLLVGGMIWVEWIHLQHWLLLGWNILLYLLAIFTVYTGVAYFVRNKTLYMDDL